MAKHKIKPVAAVTDFAELEEKLLKHWYESGIVSRYLHKNDQSHQRFSFIDGPITANNPMGVHHGWGRTYKDLWQRYCNLKGYKQRFQNGFDCQGLWVEVEVEKELGFKSKKDIEAYGVAKFVQKCKDRVLKYAAIQTEQSKRLGYFMDWDNSYYTMSDENNYMIWHFLKVCHENGWIYQGTDVVPWCPRCETAISQHEMLTEDYQEITHETVYVRVPIRGRDNEYLLFWTTTPWTVPGNIAIAVDKDLDYVLVESGGKKYWVVKQRKTALFGPKAKVIQKVKGGQLLGLKYQGPFDQLTAIVRANTVVATDPTLMPINTEEGTGLVHTSTGTGEEDHHLGRKLGLPLVAVINERAEYLADFGELAGKNAKTHPRIVIDQLKSGDWLLKTETHTHRYPACWRCKTELVWRLTDEWYIAMDKGKPTLRQRMVKVAKKISWIPKFGLDRELDWLKNMHDWLISKKNRYWGLCLPIWECNRCGQFEVIGSREELKNRAVAGWEQFEGKSPHKPQLDAVKIKCSHCGESVSRVEPVGNPWLDAGIVPFSTLNYTSDKSSWQQWYPADFITESFPGQFKNWFYSLIAMATVLDNTPPFKVVLGFATLLGEDGRPMHKSWGNAVEFNQGAKAMGVDVMRWLYCRQNPAQNLLFGFNTAAAVKRSFHLLLWNAYRFFVNYAIVDNWKPGSRADYSPLDRWVLSRLSHTTAAVTSHLDHFDAFHATAVLESFVSDLSTWYIRRSRDRLDKHACYSTLYTVFDSLSRLLAPFTPFISDVIYTNLTGEASVHLSSWPKLPSRYADPKLERQMADLRRVVELGQSQRKTFGLPLRQPLASLTVSGAKIPENLVYLLAEELNVKQVNLTAASDELKVTLDTRLTPKLKAEGQARELIRQIQQARKTAGTQLDEWVEVELPDWPSEWSDLIKQQTLARRLIKSTPEVGLRLWRTSGVR